jgi:hypothetical protein
VEHLYCSDAASKGTSVEYCRKCTGPKSKLYQKAPGRGSGIWNRFSCATPHSPPAKRMFLHVGEPCTAIMQTRSRHRRLPGSRASAYQQRMLSLMCAACADAAPCAVSRCGTPVHHGSGIDVGRGLKGLHVLGRTPPRCSPESNTLW